MERTIPHSMTYTDTGEVSVADVAASLIANEKLLVEAIKAFEQLIPEVEVTEYRVVFRQARIASPLVEGFEIVANLVTQGHIEHVIPDGLRSISREADSAVTITILTIGLILGGIIWKLRKAGKEDQVAGVTVTGNYNSVIVAGSDIVGVPPERLRAVIDARYAKGNAPSLARQSLATLRPAFHAGTAAIEGGGVRIDPESIAAAKTIEDQEPEEEREAQEALSRQPVVIHATDLDYQKSGWAGHLPGVWDKRLPMKLFPSIDPDDIFGKRDVIGDVILMLRKGDDGEYYPYLFHLIAIHPA